MSVVAGQGGKGPVQAAAVVAVERMALEAGSGEYLLGQLVVSLARAVDAAVQRGSASAAAMAARELRDTVSVLAAARDVPEADPFDVLAARLRDSASAASGEVAR